MANTKLTPEQKLNLKQLRVDQDGGVQIINLDNKSTMAWQFKGNTVEFALSVMSPDEKKFRPKVGEYIARSRFDNGETVKMDRGDFGAMCEAVWEAYPL
jgi:hypothetical protein